MQTVLGEKVAWLIILLMRALYGDSPSKWNRCLTPGSVPITKRLGARTPQRRNFWWFLVEREEAGHPGENVPLIVLNLTAAEQLPNQC